MGEAKSAGKFKLSIGMGAEELVENSYLVSLEEVVNLCDAAPVVPQSPKVRRRRRQGYHYFLCSSSILDFRHLKSIWGLVRLRHLRLM
jgi:hypothetical protein